MDDRIAVPLPRNVIKTAAVSPSGDTPDDISFPAESFRYFDRTSAAAMARATGGLSPAALWLAFSDWAIHLGAAPGKQMELGLKAWRTCAELSGHAVRSMMEGQAPPYIKGTPEDARFRGAAWQALPYRLFYQNFLSAEEWWRMATHDIAGVSPHHEDVVSFATRQWLDTISPSILPLTNPVVTQATIRTGGQNLVSGLSNWIDDMHRMLARQGPRRCGGV